MAASGKKTSSGKKSGSSSRSKSAAAKKAAATRAAKKEAAVRARETWGVAFGSIGILLLIYMFVSSRGIFGEWLSNALFGFLGTLAYSLPVLFIWFAYRNIFADDHPSLNGTGPFVLLSVVCIVTLLQVLHTDAYENVKYLPYLRQAFQKSFESHVGGGFVGSIFAYPILLLGDRPLGFILPIAGLICCCVRVFGISIRRTTRMAADSVEHAAAHVKSSVQESREAYIQYAEDRRQRRETKMAFFSASGEDEKPVPGKEPASLPVSDPMADVNEYEAPRNRRKKKPETIADIMDDILEDLPAAKNNVAVEPERHVRGISEDSENITTVPARFTEGEAVSIPERDTPLPEVTYYRSVMHRDEELVPVEEPANISGDAPQRIEEAAVSAQNKMDIFDPCDAIEPMECDLPSEVSVEFYDDTAEEKEVPQENIFDHRDTPTVATVTELKAEKTTAPAAYTPPPFHLLNAPGPASGKSESPEAQGQLLIDTLKSFGIECKLSDISRGPVLTRYELVPAPGIRVSRISALSNDLALALAADRVRIEAPIPGKAAVGIEVPNKNAATVVLREIVESHEFKSSASPITLAFGKGISGKVITADLGKMPHLLIAGSTGSGKSVCINDLIVSMVYKSSPEELKFVLIDPKMVELTAYTGLPHLLMPVVTDPKKAAGALRWAVNEMTKRYNAFAEKGARELTRYNMLMEQENPGSSIPRIVIIIDELADLMMVAAEDVEDCISRIAALGRAAGIHLIVATQRPSADVITGVIKANIPSRCAFMVSSGIDSRIILDATGAEKLIGRGDMLFHMNGANKPIRLQCAFVSDEEVERVVDYFRVLQRNPAFDEKLIEEINNSAVGGPTGGAFGEGKQEDDLLADAVRIAIEAGQASTSLLQRRLRVGYARGSRLLDMMEQAGYVSEQDGTKPRRVLIKRSQYQEIFGVALPAPEKQVDPNA